MARNDIALSSMNKLVGTHSAEVLNRLGVTSQSLVTLGVVRETRILQKQKAELEIELIDLRKEFETANNRLNAEFAVVCKRLSKEQTPAFTAFTKAAGIESATVEHEAEFAHKDDKDNPQKLFIRARYGTKRGNCGSITTTSIIDTPEHVTKAYLATQKVAQEITKADNELVEVRVKLQNVGNLERESNARMTHAVLSQSDEGQAILKQLGLESLE